LQLSAKQELNNNKKIEQQKAKNSHILMSVSCLAEKMAEKVPLSA
jgi:hypothetical protein